MRTPEETAKIDAIIRHDPVELALDLWGRLRDIGDMPPLTAEHLREILIVLRKERGEWPRSNERPAGTDSPHGMALR